eukprot:gene2050-1556_t
MSTEKLIKPKKFLISGCSSRDNEMEDALINTPKRKGIAIIADSEETEQWFMSKFMFLFRNEEVGGYEPKNEYFTLAYKFSSMENSLEYQIPVGSTSDSSLFSPIFLRAQGVIIVVDMKNSNKDFILLLREHFSSIDSEIPINFVLLDSEIRSNLEEKIAITFCIINKPRIVTLKTEENDFENIEKISKWTAKIWV